MGVLRQLRAFNCPLPITDSTAFLKLFGVIIAYLLTVAIQFLIWKWPKRDEGNLTKANPITKVVKRNDNGPEKNVVEANENDENKNDNTSSSDKKHSPQ
ncbi:MAG: hypothetical protein MHMPM18_000714 [Marteilia pararefringens]